MGRLIFTLLIGLLMASAVQAGGRASVEYLVHNLNLDDQQRLRVEGIMSDQHATHKELRRAGKATCEAKKKMWLQTRTRMYEVLNEEQLKKYDELQKRRQRRCALQVQAVATNKTSQPL